MMIRQLRVEGNHAGLGSGMRKLFGKCGFLSKISPVVANNGEKKCV